MIERRRAESGKEPEPAVVPPVPYYSVKPKTELLLEQLVTSPFTVAIDAAQPPKDFTQQKFNQFEPAKIKALTHLVYYRQMMSLWNDNDTLMCRMFSSSLGALGLYWFHRLKQRSISSFKMLSASFLTRFVMSYKKEKDINTLLSLRKTSLEMLWEYTNRYWETFNDMDDCTQYVKVVMSAFKNGLDKTAKECYSDLYLHPPPNMEEMLTESTSIV